MKATVSDEKAIELLRGAIRVPPLNGPSRDLLPVVRKRMSRGARTGPIQTTDWLLAAAIVLLCLLRPGLAGMLLLHF